MSIKLLLHKLRMAKTTMERAQVEQEIENMVNLKQIGIMQLLRHTTCSCPDCSDVRVLATYKREKLL